MCVCMSVEPLYSPLITENIIFFALKWVIWFCSKYFLETQRTSTETFSMCYDLMVKEINEPDVQGIVMNKKVLVMFIFNNYILYNCII